MPRVPCALAQPVKAAPLFAYAQFGTPEQILALPAPVGDFLLVDVMYRYARVIAQARRKDVCAAQQELAALTALADGGDFKPFEAWGVPAREIAQTAKLVAIARIADAQGDLDAAARAYEAAIAVEDALAYTEPPFWYYPVRQTLAAVLLESGRPAEAIHEFQASLHEAPNNAFALYGLMLAQRAAGDATGAKATRALFDRAWAGGTELPELARL